MHVTAQKVKFSIKNFFSKGDQIRSFRQIWSHWLKKSFMENFIFCSVCAVVFLADSFHFFQRALYYFICKMFFFRTEAVTLRCSLKKVFQLSHKNSPVNISEYRSIFFFGKIAGQRSAALLKRYSGTGVFLWIWQNV